MLSRCGSMQKRTGSPVAPLLLPPLLRSSKGKKGIGPSLSSYLSRDSSKKLLMFKSPQSQRGYGMKFGPHSEVYC